MIIDGHCIYEFQQEITPLVDVYSGTLCKMNEIIIKMDWVNIRQLYFFISFFFFFFFNEIF